MSIDLRSDTVTQPSPAMRREIAEAEVGDDVLDGDPTTHRLESRVAELFGMEAALFFPSGTQANQVAIWLLTEPGTELLVEEHSHLIDYELAGLAAISGIQVRPVATPDGRLTSELVQRAWRPASRFLPRISAMTAENTHNAAGGMILPLEDWDALVDVAGERGVPIHLDGARLWHAAVALGVPLSRVARGATTVMVSFSKGLGCPIGSCLIGSRALMERAWEVRKRFGGGLRQSGILAAAALYALDHNYERLADDHENARLLAERLEGHSAVSPVRPETNIVMFDLVRPEDTAASAVDRLAAAGVRVVEFGSRRFRAVLHLDVTRDNVIRAAAIVADTLQ